MADADAVPPEAAEVRDDAPPVESVDAAGSDRRADAEVDGKEGGEDDAVAAAAPSVGAGAGAGAGAGSAEADAGGGGDGEEGAPSGDGDGSGGLAEFVEVPVYDDTGEIVDISRVYIERDLERKPYYGGFRRKHSGVEYHHACTQTLVERTPKWAGKPPAVSRETQTVTLSTRSAQTMRECATQMSRRDLYIDTSRDVELTPRPYFSSEQLLALKTEKTQILQNHWRGYCARKRAWEMREESAKAAHAAYVAEQEAAKAAEAAHQEEVRRRMHPRTGKDFEILYNELEAWRAAETRRIKAEGLPEREQLEALAQLLHKETKLLQTIDRLKITAASENREKRIAKVLEQMAAPKKWEMGDGEVATVHTPFSTRAKELMDLYKGLQMSLSTQERLDVLLHVKWTVKQFKCQLTDEICDLIDREADMLHRGRPERTMEGLRKRLSNMFLTFVETPEFNPEAARFQKAPAVV